MPHPPMRTSPSCSRGSRAGCAACSSAAAACPRTAGATDPLAAQEPLFATTVAASLQGRVALGPRAGQAVRRLRSAAAARDAPPRCARLEGFSLPADVAVPADRRDRLEHRCRSLLRPPLALERVTETSGGQLLYQRRRPWADGSVALLLEPLELSTRPRARST